MLAVFLFAEAAAVAAAAVLLLFELLADTPSSYASAVAILVLTLFSPVLLLIQ